MDSSTLTWLATRGHPGTSTRRLYAGELARFATFRATLSPTEPIALAIVIYLLDEHRLGRQRSTLRWKRKVLIAYFLEGPYEPQRAA